MQPSHSNIYRETLCSFNFRDQSGLWPCLPNNLSTYGIRRFHISRLVWDRVFSPSYNDAHPRWHLRSECQAHAWYFGYSFMFPWEKLDKIRLEIRRYLPFYFLKEVCAGHSWYISLHSLIYVITMSKNWGNNWSNWLHFDQFRDAIIYVIVLFR
jgi:hypothetical protein